MFSIRGKGPSLYPIKSYESTILIFVGYMGPNSYTVCRLVMAQENVETVVQEPTLISNEPMKDAWTMVHVTWGFPGREDAM